MEYHDTILTIDKIPGELYAEGFVHNIYRAASFVYKIAKPGFQDYASYRSVMHELRNMKYLSQKGFKIPEDYRVFCYGKDFGLQMSFVEGTPLSEFENCETIFSELLKSTTSVTENWAGAPDNRFAAWNQHLSYVLQKQINLIAQIPFDDLRFLEGLIIRVENKQNSILLIDANPNNVIIGKTGEWTLIDMDRLVLGDTQFQCVYIQYQHGNINGYHHPRTMKTLLYAVLIVIEDIYFRICHGLQYAEQLLLYRQLLEELKCQ